MSAPSIGVAVVTYNTKQYWPRLKAALEAQTLQAFRLVVIDNASAQDERFTQVDMPAQGELVQFEANFGFAAANNHAFSRLDADYFICLNPDAFPEPDWLARLVAAAEADPLCGAIGSLQVCAHDPTLLDGAGDEYWIGGLAYRALHLRKRAAPRTAAPFSACAAAALYRREAFQAAGGFDSRFFCYCEDVDLGFRLRLLGWRIRQANDAIVAHVGGGASGGHSDFARYHGTRNRVWTFVKNMPGPLLILAAPLHIGATLFILIWSLFRGSARVTWRGVLDGVRGIPVMMHMRRNVQRQRRASSLDIARACVWSPFSVLQRAPRRGGD